MKKQIQVRLAGPMQTDSIINGEGLRTVIWFQGCEHNCQGCHNVNAIDVNGGILVNLFEIKEQINDLQHQDGFTFSGGEPFLQPEAILEIAKEIKKLNLSIWCYTGYVFEYLAELSKTEPMYMEILQLIDVLVDGKFILAEKSLNLKFKGSKNQRIVDVKKSLKRNETILIPKYKREKKILVMNK